MTPPFDVTGINHEIDRLIQVGQLTAERMTRPKEKALLAAAVEKLRAIRDAGSKSIPAAAERLKQLGDAQLAHTQRLQAELLAMQEQLKATLAAQEAAKAAAAAVPAAAPAPPAAKPCDQDLGRRLRDELLAEIGEQPDAGPRRPGKDIWEDWK